MSKIVAGLLVSEHLLYRWIIASVIAMALWIAFFFFMERIRGSLISQWREGEA